MNPANAQDQTAAAVIQKELQKRREIELLYRVFPMKKEVVQLRDDGPSAFKPVVMKEKAVVQPNLLDFFELGDRSEEPAVRVPTAVEPQPQEPELSPSWSESTTSPRLESNEVKK